MLRRGAAEFLKLTNVNGHSSIANRSITTATSTSASSIMTKLSNSHSRQYQYVAIRHFGVVDSMTGFVGGKIEQTRGGWMGRKVVFCVLSNS